MLIRLLSIIGFFAGVLFKLPELEKQDIEDANPETTNKKKRLKTI